MEREKERELYNLGGWAVRKDDDARGAVERRLVWHARQHLACDMKRRNVHCVSAKYQRFQQNVIKMSENFSKNVENVRHIKRRRRAKARPARPAASLLRPQHSKTPAKYLKCQQNVQHVSKMPGNYQRHKTRRCRRVTYPESYITKYTTYTKKMSKYQQNVRKMADPKCPSMQPSGCLSG